MATTADRLPRWDMNPIFPGLDTPAFDAAFQEVIDAIAALAELYDAHDVRRHSGRPVNEALAAVVEEVIRWTNAVYERMRTMHWYLQACVTTDAADAMAQARASALRNHAVRLNQLRDAADRLARHAGRGGAGAPASTCCVPASTSSSP